MGLFSSILGAVAGPIIGLFGKKKEKPQKTTTTSYVDYAKMARDAQAAGFNPLTALRNGGSAGFSSTVTTAPALSSGSFSGGVGEALANGISAWASYDPMAEKKADLEYQLVQEQLKTVQRMNRQERKSFDVPSNTGTTGRVSSGGFAHSVPVTGAAAGGTQFTGSDPWTGSVFDPYMKIHPGVPGADPLSSRYGEIVEMIGGVAVLGGDLAYSGYKLANRQGNVDKAVGEAKKAWADTTAGYRAFAKGQGAASTAFAKGLIPSRDRPYYPDMDDLRRGRGPAW